MKVNKETTMLVIPSGSRLYGTFGPQSDFDFKAIVLPGLDDLLLNKKLTNRKEKPEGNGPQDKMEAGETETEYLPLQVFFDDFFNGQTYALEVAFAIKQGLHTSYNPDLTTNLPCQFCFIDDMDMAAELIDLFLTKNVKKMMGYAVSQARLYGVKTERYSAVKAAVKILEELYPVSRYVDKQSGTTLESLMQTPLVECLDKISSLVELPHVKLVDIETGDGSGNLIKAIDIIGKQYPLTNKIGTIVKSLKIVTDSYGDRVKEFQGQGVDWKALSHAIRIVEQVIELSTLGTITFPRPNADYLRRVKAGEVPLDDALAVMSATFNAAEKAVDASILKDRTPELEKQFNQWKIEKLRLLYRLPV